MLSACSLWMARSLGFLGAVWSFASEIAQLMMGKRPKNRPIVLHSDSLAEMTSRDAAREVRLTPGLLELVCAMRWASGKVVDLRNSRATNGAEYCVGTGQSVRASRVLTLPANQPASQSVAGQKHQLTWMSMNTLSIPDSVESMVLSLLRKPFSAAPLGRRRSKVARACAAWGWTTSLAV